MLNSNAVLTESTPTQHLSNCVELYPEKTLFPVTGSRDLT